MNLLKIKIEENQIIVEGELTQATVPVALLETRSLLSSHTMTRINLKKVTRCDSASLAYVIGLLRTAKKLNNGVEFVDLPHQMEQLAKVSSLLEFLPIADIT